MRTLRFLGAVAFDVAMMGLVTAASVQHEWRRYRCEHRH
jgi:hypothetical protein